jgi:hypothetical protein
VQNLVIQAGSEGRKRGVHDVFETFDLKEELHTGHDCDGSVKLIIQHARSMYNEVRSALLEAV